MDKKGLLLFLLLFWLEDEEFKRLFNLDQFMVRVRLFTILKQRLFIVAPPDLQLFAMLG